MKKAERLKFKFDGAHPEGSGQTTHRGKIQCDLCEERFKSPHIQISIDDFRICPTCVNAGPAVLAAEATRVAGDVARIVRIWDYNMKNELDRENATDMVGAYSRLAAALVELHSFEELPGGKMALAVAAVLQAPADRRKRKAA